jgi:hypothetical protein
MTAHIGESAVLAHPCRCCGENTDHWFCQDCADRVANGSNSHGQDPPEYQRISMNRHWLTGLKYVQGTSRSDLA